MAVSSERDTKVGREWIAGDVSRETSVAVMKGSLMGPELKKWKRASTYSFAAPLADSVAYALAGSGYLPPHSQGGGQEERRFVRRSYVRFGARDVSRETSAAIHRFEARDAESEGVHP